MFCTHWQHVRWQKMDDIDRLGDSNDRLSTSPTPS